MVNIAIPPGEIVVDSRGRTSLARVRTHDYDRYLAREHEDGTIVLTPAITVTPAELEKIRQDRGWLGPGDRVLRLPGKAPREPSAAEREGPCPGCTGTGPHAGWCYLS